MTNFFESCQFSKKNLYNRVNIREEIIRKGSELRRGVCWFVDVNTFKLIFRNSYCWDISDITKCKSVRGITFVCPGHLDLVELLDDSVFDLFMNRINRGKLKIISAYSSWVNPWRTGVFDQTFSIFDMETVATSTTFLTETLRYAEYSLLFAMCFILVALAVCISFWIQIIML